MSKTLTHSADFVDGRFDFPEYRITLAIKGNKFDRIMMEFTAPGRAKADIWPNNNNEITDLHDADGFTIAMDGLQMMVVGIHPGLENLCTTYWEESGSTEPMAMKAYHEAYEFLAAHWKDNTPAGRIRKAIMDRASRLALSAEDLDMMIRNYTVDCTSWYDVNMTDEHLFEDFADWCNE